DCRHHLRVLSCDGADRLDAIDQVAKASRAEQDRDRRVLLAGDVESSQSIAEAPLGNREIPSRQREMPRVDRALSVDCSELLRGTVVCLDRLLQLAVQRLDLRQYALRLGSLGGDLRRLGSRGQTRGNKAADSKDECYH